MQSVVNFVEREGADNVQFSSGHQPLDFSVTNWNQYFDWYKDGDMGSGRPRKESVVQFFLFFVNRLSQLNLKKKMYRSAMTSVCLGIPDQVLSRKLKKFHRFCSFTLSKNKTSSKLNYKAVFNFKVSFSESFID